MAVGMVKAAGKAAAMPHILGHLRTFFDVYMEDQDEQIRQIVIRMYGAWRYGSDGLLLSGRER